MSERPRLTVEVEQRQKDALKALLPHGTLKPMIGYVLDMFISGIKTHGFGSLMDALIKGQAHIMIGESNGQPRRSDNSFPRPISSRETQPDITIEDFPTYAQGQGELGETKVQ